jgi:uncharacterized protein with PIN domain
MKFIADAMLGRLARWLRLLGYDTSYYPHIDDSFLLRLAREEKRILLTRDTRLVKVRGLPDFLLLHENDSFEQLRTVISTFDLTGDIEARIFDGDTFLSRCAVCNTLLQEKSKEESKSHVPEYVFQTCRIFKYCPECNKYYWKGTHPMRLQKKLKEILYN